jgi:hypothetical protein
MSERYKHLQGHLYYDTQEKVIVQHMGDRYVFLRHDRRVRNQTVENEKRSFLQASKSMIEIQRGLYFDRNTKQIYKKSGDKLVLFAKDRRKSSRAVGVERRKR